MFQPICHVLRSSFVLHTAPCGANIGVSAVHNAKGA